MFSSINQKKLFADEKYKQTIDDWIYLFSHLNLIVQLVEVLTRSIY